MGARNARQVRTDDKGLPMLDWDLNLLAIIAAVAAHQALGFLWYGALFGKTWLQAMGKTQEDLQGAGSSIAIAAVASVVTAVALALLVNLADEPDLATGLTYGLVAGVGIAATSIVTSAAYEDKNATVASLYVGYQVLGLAIMGAILGAWR